MAMFFDTKFLRNDEIILRLRKTAPADSEKGYVPAYYFDICLAHTGKCIGACDLRIGHTQNVYYGGNIGYSIQEEHRGHHYAGKACLLLFELARLHNMDDLYITCSPENTASRKTCEYVGGTLETIADLPPDNEMYQKGDRKKCIYKVTLEKDGAGGAI